MTRQKSDSCSDHAELRSLYRRLWEKGDQALRSGSHELDSIPEHGDYRWGLSAVLRTESPVLENLTAELVGLREACVGPHLVYHPSELHSTIRSLEGFQNVIPAEQIKHYVNQLRWAVDDLGPIEVEYRGLGSSQGGIFVCGYPSPALAELRARLHSDQLPLGALGVASADSGRTRSTAHVSMVLYRMPLSIETQLADFVASRLDRPYGTAYFSHVSLVRYSPNPASVGLEEIARIKI